MSDIRPSEDVPSGRFLLRIEPGLHAALRRAASEEQLSLNEYCSRKLRAPLGGLTAFEGAVEAIGWAAELFGGDLTAVALYGSWARGEATDRSDVDLLLVLEPDVFIERSLYRRWDEREIRWGGHEVEPHFVHLPEPEGRIGGMWAEVAIDGIVLFERELALSRALIGVRRRMLEGRLIRRWAHGQPYWMEVA